MKYSLIIFFCLQVLAKQIGVTPYLTEHSKTSISVCVECATNTYLKINHGTSAQKYTSQKFVLADNYNGSYIYEAEIQNLKPGIKYFYKIENIKGAVSDLYSFNIPLKKECRFVVMGDSRSQTNIFSEIMRQADKVNPDIIISMGDLVENGGERKQWKKQFFDVSKPVINHIPFISTLGDHEGEWDEGRLFAHYFFPKKNHKKLWSSFDVGNAHFVSLDYRYPRSEEMINWFKKDIKQTDAKWKFVFMHRPCYNSGGHCSMWGRGNWPELFRRYKVDIVFSGHSHIYERFLPVRPSDSNGWAVTYITTGGAGANLYEVGSNNFLAKTFSDYHFIYFDIKNNILSMKVFSTNNFLFDELTINKKGNRFDKKYFSRVIPQEKLNFITEFTRLLTESLTLIPLKTVPFIKKISLKYKIKNKKIKFKIHLAKESREFYEMESLESVLYGNKRKDFELKIFSKCDITVSQWGEIKPPLRLEGEFEIDDEKLKIDSGKIRYWPVN